MVFIYNIERSVLGASINNQVFQILITLINNTFNSFFKRFFAIETDCNNRYLGVHFPNTININKQINNKNANALTYAFLPL